MNIYIVAGAIYVIIGGVLLGMGLEAKTPVTVTVRTNQCEDGKCKMKLEQKTIKEDSTILIDFDKRVVEVKKSTPWHGIAK